MTSRPATSRAAALVTPGRPPQLIDVPVPDEIDTVLITHLHADHVGWVTHERDGRRAFGRATYWVSDPEWDFWTSPRMLASPPDHEAKNSRRSPTPGAP